MKIFVTKALAIAFLLNSSTALAQSASAPYSASYAGNGSAKPAIAETIDLIRASDRLPSTDQAVCVRIVLSAEEVSAFEATSLRLMDWLRRVERQVVFRP